MTLANLLKLAKLTHQFQQVERTILATGTERNENDAEHSYQLALMAIYWNNLLGHKFRTDKLVLYALLHDLVEIYAGDTFFHTTDQQARDSKEEREQAAAQRLREEFPDFTTLGETIAAYEARADEEARFIYALDKLAPVINIYLDGGKSWRRDGVNLEMIYTKDAKIALSPEVEVVWQELKKLLDAEQEQLFF